MTTITMQVEPRQAASPFIVVSPRSLSSRLVAACRLYKRARIDSFDQRHILIWKDALDMDLVAHGLLTRIYRKKWHHSMIRHAHRDACVINSPVVNIKKYCTGSMIQSS
jgi:hypothetical protein